MIGAALQSPGCHGYREALSGEIKEKTRGSPSSPLLFNFVSKLPGEWLFSIVNLREHGEDRSPFTFHWPPFEIKKTLKAGDFCFHHLRMAVLLAMSKSRKTFQTHILNMENVAGPGCRAMTCAAPRGLCSGETRPPS